MLEISLPGIFEDQGSGYLLRVSKVTLKWTDPVKILAKVELESNLVQLFSIKYSCASTLACPKKRNNWPRELPNIANSVFLFIEFTLKFLIINFNKMKGCAGGM